MDTGERDPRHGVTGAKTLEGPNEYGLELSLKMHEELKNLHTFETEENLERRKNVLRHLSKMVKDWVYETAVSKGLPDDVARAAGGGIFAFGSYRLGVVLKDADVDALLLAPKHADRDSFFETFQKKLSETKAVKNIVPVAGAHTPVIKFTFAGVDIDLVFASLPIDRIDPTQGVGDDNIVSGLTDGMTRSVNGARVAEKIIELIPNYDSFREALYLVKVWAVRRGIYGNKWGYLAGVTCALLVARVCQLFPNFSPAQLVACFFEFYRRHDWRRPITLKDINQDYAKQMEEGFSHHRVWNPKQDKKDFQHKMPVITPAFPGMNSTHNVFTSTLEAMKREFKRGAEITGSLIADDANRKTREDVYSTQQAPSSTPNTSPTGKPILPSAPASMWKRLLVEAKTEVFRDHRHFLEVRVVGHTEKLYDQWKGFVESRVRFLYMALETNVHGYETTLRPWPEWFKDPTVAAPAKACITYCAMTFKPKDEALANSQPVNLRHHIANFTTDLQKHWKIQGGTQMQLSNHEVEIKICHKPRKEIPDFIKQALSSSTHSNKTPAASPASVLSPPPGTTPSPPGPAAAPVTGPGVLSASASTELLPPPAAAASAGAVGGMPEEGSMQMQDFSGYQEGDVQDAAGLDMSLLRQMLQPDEGAEGGGGSGDANGALPSLSGGVNGESADSAAGLEEHEGGGRKRRAEERGDDATQAEFGDAAPSSAKKPRETHPDEEGEQRQADAPMGGEEGAGASATETRKPVAKQPPPASRGPPKISVKLKPKKK
uniref:polynucleotide adenylyltransferase n=1 Tax=Chromera velia CCMP2878 TaxID=1169474 RepID=A0A0G4FAH2_9ALVE|mmetsp:Transcript_7758/g.15087  ORF Transcript_7758/g.15087 Transcript_7758/m.15087 type:complete len:774 (-) Transcript_7758:161-2482(-)|eukprot:Cvel_16026.t1-p1 / transcript=Cvel_16026.t1 / gene=Cvel_16026 / organism=Chromera_velia_CCMP2878 / gene_product=Poly(A) polymerase gamma, putative / transcript_product=Poly(A) polymerase gamma, putative / location=Cvel_scaffold1216:27495-33705(+) / protein_length=773 / sequence_SO=supercontig / SO=protein_coding / is_pseudo=false